MRKRQRRKKKGRQSGEGAEGWERPDANGGRKGERRITKCGKVGRIKEERTKAGKMIYDFLEKNRGREGRRWA